MSGSTTAMTQNLKTQTGNRVAIQFANTDVGLLQSARFSDDYGLEDASGIGDIHVVEHVPSKAVHTVTASKMVLLADKMRSLGISIENGDQALQGMVFDVVVYSRDTGLALRKYTSLSFATGDVSIDAHRIVVTNATFRALDAKGTGI